MDHASPFSCTLSFWKEIRSPLSTPIIYPTSPCFFLDLDAFRKRFIGFLSFSPYIRLCLKDCGQDSVRTFRHGTTPRRVSRTFFAASTPRSEESPFLSYLFWAIPFTFSVQFFQCTHLQGSEVSYNPGYISPISPPLLSLEPSLFCRTHRSAPPASFPRPNPVFFHRVLKVLGVVFSWMERVPYEFPLSPSSSCITYSDRV